MPAAAQIARARGVPVIAFSTDSSVAGRGVYLLSFLPESDVNRIVDYAAARKAIVRGDAARKRLWQCGRGGVQAGGGARGGRVVAFERTAPIRQMQARHASRRRCRRPMRCCIADDGEAVRGRRDALTAAGADLSTSSCSARACGTIRATSQSPALQGGLYAAPDPAGFRSFRRPLSCQIRREPVRTATLAYDAVALVAALAKTQGAQRFAPEMLTNPSGFAGIDGLFRFRPDGTNERGLAVMRVASGGGPPVAGSPKSFGA